MNLVLRFILALTAICILPNCASKSAKRPVQKSYPPGYHSGVAKPQAPAYGNPQYPAARPVPTPIPQYQPPPSMGLAKSAPWIHAESYILLDANSGRILSAKNATTLRGAASTQKLLTALIVAETGNLDKPVRVMPSDVAVEPTKLGVKPGDVYTRRELLNALLVKSCNDVANILARDNAGSVTAFTARMNQRAKYLGAHRSHFTNPHGLTASGQYSNAYDIGRIAMVAYRNPVIREIVRKRSYAFKFNDGRVVTLQNTNKILPRMVACNGMKTGYTVAAGRCLVSSASQNGKQVILVQLGTKTKYIWDDGIALMQWGLAHR